MGEAGQDSALMPHITSPANVAVAFTRRLEP